MPKRMNSKTVGEGLPSVGGNLTDKMIQEDYAEYVNLKKDEEKAKKEYQTAQSYVRKHLKNHKGRGGDTKQLQDRYVESLKSAEERRIELALQNRYRNALNMGMDLVEIADHMGGAAMTNDSGDADHARLESIEDKGYAAAKAGKERNEHDYPVASDEEHAHFKGWDRALI